MAGTAAEPIPLKLGFGRDQNTSLVAGVSVLSGETVEDIFGPAQRVGRTGAFELFEVNDWLLGVGAMPVTAGPELPTERLYHEMFEASRGLGLARIWNYVPAINRNGPSGMENYRSFCSGRSRAFERKYGSGFKASMPSASAVGCNGDELSVVFAACKSAARHFENPLQVPAYDYPADYGPRSPSFARATVVRQSAGITVFVSGTAAIRGHATVSPHHTHEQLECAVENLRQISLVCGFGADLAMSKAGIRHFKVYLRHPDDQPQVAEELERTLLRADDRVSYLHADICRAALNVEIEATLRLPPDAGGA